MRQAVVLAIVIALGLGAAGYAMAQDSATPPAASELCATPAGAGATPAGVEMGTPTGQVQVAAGDIAPSPTLLFPCATPESGSAP